MAQSKFRKAIGAVKDRTSISLAKVGNNASLSDLDVAIVKATRHEEYPAEERHIREILSLTCYSRAYVSACVDTISRRLNKTKNWVVALKVLLLIQRLLSDGDPSYEQEIFFATRRGTRLLNMSDFRDTSQSNSWDYSAFVRTYALYLDEQLEFRMQGRRGRRSTFSYDADEEEEINPGTMVVRTTPVHEMKNEQIFSKMQHLVRLLDRFLACKPTGAAKHNRIVLVALYPIVKESFQLYYDITELIGVLIERFMELDVSDSVKVYDNFCHVAKQYDELDTFYAWCKTVGLARSSEYPEVEKIKQKKLDIMDEFIREKSAMAQKPRIIELRKEPAQEVKDPEPEEEMNKIKALPAPEMLFPEEEEEEEEQKVEEEVKEEEKPKQQEADLLHLGDDAPTTEEQADKLALALFDGGPATAAAPDGPPAWEAFSESSDWETALVETASHLQNQKTSLPGGFDMMVLNGMYQQGTTVNAVASSGCISTGSASSVALGSAGRPAMLALPAPPKAEGSDCSTINSDPFAASLAIVPPPYVQISDMEKKQKLLVEEQQMWLKYERDGRQGHIALAQVQQNQHPYNVGGYK